MNISEIIKYLTDLGFEEIPSRLPKNAFNSFKRDVYIDIMKKYPKIYTYLSKVSPIKYKKIRPDLSLWFKIDNFELELKPDKAYDYWMWDSSWTWGMIVSPIKNWSILLVYPDRLNRYGNDTSFSIDTDDDPNGVNYWSIFSPIDHIERYLSQFPEVEGYIKTYRRNKKLEELI
jgi:hypothetical protein